MEYGSRSLSNGSRSPRSRISSRSFALSMLALVICLSNSWGGLEQVAANDAIDLGRTWVFMSACFASREARFTRNCKAHPEIKSSRWKMSPGGIAISRSAPCFWNEISQGVNLIHVHQTSLLGSIVPWIWNMPESGSFCLSPHHEQP